MLPSQVAYQVSLDLQASTLLAATTRRLGVADTAAMTVLGLSSAFDFEEGHPVTAQRPIRAVT